jgi:chemotaxis protein MotA
VQTFHDPAKLGQGVAEAFAATLYGVAVANFFLLPMAAKLRQRARDEWFRKTIIMSGILSIQAGEHPMLMEEKLTAYLSGQADPLVQDKDPFCGAYAQLPTGV